ncbi:MAG: hypothetical protein WCO56_21655 [Verrucomicrobiota bacterium]
MRITDNEVTNYRGFTGNAFRLILEQGQYLLIYGKKDAGNESLEKEIDAIVFRLSALTPEEIKLVEETTPK